MSCCGGGMWMMWLGLLLLAALVVGGLIVARVLWTRARSERQQGHDGPALEVLEELYARGEIDRDEFERRRATLSSRPGRGKA